MRKLGWLVCAAMMMGLPALAQQTEWNPERAAQDAAPPEHPVTVDQVREMIQLSGAMSLARQAMQSLIPAIRQMMPPYVPADVLDDINRRLFAADLETTVIHAYQAHLSTEDGAAIIAFYKTPAGQRLLGAMPQIMKESQQAGARMGQQIVSEVIEKHHAEIEAARAKYVQEHSGSAPHK
jgi:uncharacterized protein